MYLDVGVKVKNTCPETKLRWEATRNEMRCFQ